MSETEDRPYQDPEGDPQDRMRKEKVRLDGGSVWVWELNTAEMLAVKGRASRPLSDPRGGLDDGAATAWLISMCVRRSSEPGSPRVWDDLAHDKIFRLRAEESSRLVAACRRVNGIAPDEVQATEDFSGATRAPKPSGSTSSASSNSAASPLKSGPSLITR